jgi:hypothetical protein
MNKLLRNHSGPRVVPTRSTPQRLLSLVVGCWLLVVGCFSLSAATVVFTLSDLTSGSVTNRRVLITPTWLNPSNALGVLDQRMFTSGTNGTFTVTNMPAGIFACVVQAPPARTPFSILVPATNATLYAHALRIVSTNATESPNTYAWSAAASDARYLAGQAGFNGTVTNLSFLVSTITNAVELSNFMGIEDGVFNGYYAATNIVTQGDYSTFYHQTNSGYLLRRGDGQWEILSPGADPYSSTNTLAWCEFTYEEMELTIPPTWKQWTAPAYTHTVSVRAGTGSITNEAFNLTTFTNGLCSTNLTVAP